MKKLYITGIVGLLGSNLAKILKEEYEIFGADLVTENIEGITYDVFDLCDYEKLRQSIEKVSPNILIHTAAMVNVDNCEVDVTLTQRVNAELTKMIADICNEKEIKMIYISTDAVFDGTKEGLYSEEDEVNPLNEYARTKFWGEKSVLKYQNNLVLRTNIYGFNLQAKKSFGEWIISALEKNEELNMFEDIIFSPILVTDLSKIIDKCINKNLCGLYHACATGAITKYEFGVKLKEIFKIQTGKINKTRSSMMNFKAKRAKNMGMSNKKIKEELKIDIRTPEESIEQFYQLYKQKKEYKLWN